MSWKIKFINPDEALSIEDQSGCSVHPLYPLLYESPTPLVGSYISYWDKHNWRVVRVCRCLEDERAYLSEDGIYVTEFLEEVWVSKEQ